MPTEPALILASQSPRRRVLLEEAGLRFQVAPADVDEVLEDFSDPVEAARELAQRKAQAALQGRQGLERWIIAADTVVAVPTAEQFELLGKPTDPEDSERMLSLLSGSRHAVVTGVCIVRCKDGWQFAATETTWVTMRTIQPAERQAYVASEEWRGKAGGYAIQETADRFVTGLEGGGFDNVVGLPVDLTKTLLARAEAPGL